MALLRRVGESYGERFCINPLKDKGFGIGSQQIWIADSTHMRKEPFYSADSSL